MRTSSFAVAALLLALLGAGSWWMLSRPENPSRGTAAPGSGSPPPLVNPSAEPGPPAGMREGRGAILTPEPVPAPGPAAIGGTPQPVPVDAAGRSWEETVRQKTPASDPGSAARSAADIEIASVLAEDAVNKSVAPMGADLRRELDALLEWYRSHRGTAGEDAERLRRKLMTAKTDAGQVTILPAIDGPNAPKPPAPPGGVRHAGWPHTVGDVSYWVIITEEDSREYFDLLDLERDPATFLRNRIFSLASSARPKD